MADTDEQKRSREYEKYNLLNWINSNAPDSSIAREAFERVQKEHPEFLQREYPDLDHWISGARLVDHKSPHSAEELLQESPEKWIEVLLQFKGDVLHEQPDREGLLQEVTKAVNMSFDWGLRLAIALAQRKEWNSDIWGYLIKGWKQGSLSEEQWHETILFLCEYPALYTSTIAVAELVEEGVKKEDGGIQFSILPEAESLSDKIWESLQTVAEEKWEGYGWLDAAMNRSAGKVAEFWLQAVYQRSKVQGDTWEHLPDDYRTRFKQVIDGKSFAAKLGRAILGSRIHFLYNLDAKWTEENLLRLFDFDADKEKAEQVWHGFLYWGRIPSALSEDFKPLLRRAVPYIRDDSEGLRERLINHIVDILLRDPGDPLADGWYYDILRVSATTEGDRVNMATRIWHTLREASDDFKKSVWDRWLKKYWSDRTENKPIAFTKDEADRFIEWVPRLRVVLKEAVDLVCLTKPFSLYQTHLYYDIRKGKLVDTNPAEVLKLLVYILKDVPDSSLHCYELAPLYNSLVEKLGEKATGPLAEHLKRLGCL